ncbi:MAG: hypothetical protein JWO30_4672 [Fibrobacteres bacterium]|nr:hypothetical protein [Fibrobacterota bacterium]
MYGLLHFDLIENGFLWPGHSEDVFPATPLDSVLIRVTTVTGDTLGSPGMLCRRKGMPRGELKADVERCANGRLWLREAGQASFIDWKGASNPGSWSTR